MCVVFVQVRGTQKEGKERGGKNGTVGEREREKVSNWVVEGRCIGKKTCCIVLLLYLLRRERIWMIDRER